MPKVTFINADVLLADYGKGTVFYMYTPFEGKILQEVLDILHKESQLRKIRIFTHGPCTPRVAGQGWLDFSGPDAQDIYALGIFTSS